MLLHLKQYKRRIQKKYILKSLNIITFKENKTKNCDNQKCLAFAMFNGSGKFSWAHDWSCGRFTRESIRLDLSQFARTLYNKVNILIREVIAVKLGFHFLFLFYFILFFHVYYRFSGFRATLLQIVTILLP